MVINHVSWVPNCADVSALVAARVMYFPSVKYSKIIIIIIIIIIITVLRLINPCVYPTAYSNTI
jgi:hypothetical protein